jgi:hypothetical protein
MLRGSFAQRRRLTKVVGWAATKRKMCIDVNWSCAQALIWIAFRDLDLVNAAAPGGIYRYLRRRSHGIEEGVWREVTPDIAPWLWAHGPDGQLTVKLTKEVWEQRYPAARKELKRQLQSGALMAWGHGAHGGQAEAIPAVFWADARFDNDYQDAAIAYGPRWWRIFVRSGDVVALWPAAEPAVIQDRRRRGRTPRYDWLTFEQEVLRLLDEEGLPAPHSDEGWRCEADVERRMLDWCATNWQAVPAESTIRQHVSKVIARFIEGRKGR